MISNTRTAKLHHWRRRLPTASSKENNSGTLWSFGAFLCHEQYSLLLLICSLLVFGLNQPHVRYRTALLEKELREQKEANHTLQLKQAVSRSQGYDVDEHALTAVRTEAPARGNGSDGNGSSVAALEAELATYQERYKSAVQARTKCAEEILALKADIVETQLTVDDLKQKLKAERKLTADQQAKLQQGDVERAEIETQARANATQLLATVVEKDKLIQQVGMCTRVLHALVLMALGTLFGVETVRRPPFIHR